jgi:hypothetical protein
VLRAALRGAPVMHEAKENTPICGVFFERL